MKFAVEIAKMPLFTTNYVVEAEDREEAQRMVTEMLMDFAFTDEVDKHMIMTPADETYEISDTFEVNGVEAGNFFNY